MRDERELRPAPRRTGQPVPRAARPVRPQVPVGAYGLRRHAVVVGAVPRPAVARPTSRRPSSLFARRLVPEGIRPTKVGVWFVALTLLIGVAATNTGNNALYMVVALMMAALIVSGVLSRNDVRKVEVEVTPSNCVQCGAITAKGGRLTPPEGGSGPEYTLT